MTEAGTSNRVKLWIGNKFKPKRMPMPEMVTGAGSLRDLGEVARRHGLVNPLIVSDAMLERLGVVKRCTDGLANAGLTYVVFAKVLPNCPGELVEEGYALYQKEGCDGIIAVGGGSSMDCAKIIGAKVCNPKPLEKYSKTFSVAGRNKTLRDKYPPLIAIPTTAGTGSETTVAAVVFLPEKELKLVITDAVLIPKVAVLDPEVTLSLPAPVTAATGMDALTHAVESFVSVWADEGTRTDCLRAVERIGRSLETCFHDPQNVHAREQMLIASFEAGTAFTNTGVGYVHAIAHTLGAYFHVPHGVANAMVMPHVLDFYLDRCVDQFVELAYAVGAVSQYEPDGSRTKTMIAKAFVAKIRSMNANMAIPHCVSKMTAADVDRVVDRAMVEAHGEGHTWNIMDMGYPVPKYMARANMTKIVSNLLPPTSRL